MRSKVSPARLKAYEALKIIEMRDAFAQDVITKHIDGCDMSKSDKAFATRLVLGVVSMKGSLDLILDRCLKSPKDIKADVRCALRISVYEIIYLDKQKHAAVDQGVELVGIIARKARGLANYVLRRASSMKEAFPLADPDSNIDALALKFGFPPWMAAFLVSIYGKAGAVDFMSASNEPAPVYIAFNSIKEDSNGYDLLLEAKRADVGIAPVSIGNVEVEGCFELADRRCAADPFILENIEAGRICISDASAQMIANICARSAIDSFISSNPNANASTTAKELSFLELCAGRATKTILLQSAFNRILSSQIDDFVALDNVPFKVGILNDRICAYGIHVKEALCADATDLGSRFTDKRFDCVFLDSPCTGLGTLRRHPEIRWRCSPASIEEAALLDLDLLLSAADVVAKSGVLVYATCTVSPEENERAVLSFLKSDVGRGFRIVPIKPPESPDSIESPEHSGNTSSNRDISGTSLSVSDAGNGMFFRTDLSFGSPDAHFCCVLKKVSD